MNKKNLKNNDSLNRIKQKLSYKINSEVKLNDAATSIQESIPIYSIYEKENFFELSKGYFTRSYSLQQINYSMSSEEEQFDLLGYWRETYNALGDVKIGITLINKNMNISKIAENVMMKELGDDLDVLRRELNQINKDRLNEGQNGLEQQAIITIGVKANDVKDASKQFKLINDTLEKSLQKLGSKPTEISVIDKLEILYDIYNYGHEGEFITKTRVIDEDNQMIDVNSINLENIWSMGLTVNDVIGPACFNVESDYLELGDKYVCAMQLSKYGNTIKDSFFHSIIDQPFNILATLNITPMESQLAKQMLNMQLKMVREEIIETQKSNAKQQIPEHMLPLNLMEKEEEITSLIQQFSKEDERFFQTSVNILVFGDTKEELKEHIETIRTLGRRASCTINVSKNQQEEGFISALPMTIDYTKEKRTMKTTTLAMLLPFTNIELNDINGIVYSQNAVTRNLICYDRISPKNLSYNGFILGIPGSGKSYTAKLEQIQFRLKNHDVIIIDPEGEYGRTAELLNGQLVRIAPGEKICINPLDIYVDEDSDSDPVLEKADFILKLCEIILHSPWGTNAVQKTIIDQCIHQLFDKFYDDNHVLHPIPKDEMPTLTDLYKLMSMRAEPEAREIAYALELYSGDGSLNIFGGQTNVDTDNPYVVYDILSLGDTLKPVAMFIIMNSIWQKVIKNKKLGKFTYLGIDEFHLLLQDDVTAMAVQGFWKRFRKFGGVPTGLTQNISDLISSSVGSKMLSNSSFVILLNQQAEDRELVKNVFHLSENMVQYICNSPKGQGLLLNPANGICIPFYSPFPKNTLINKAITSDLREIKAYEDEEKRLAVEN